ncbi:MAG: patatin-like phospholipase family protein [Legionellaceae bacterium]|nr:patatin-like phospholipase family protein [Legionellaceae bacterium]
MTKIALYLAGGGARGAYQAGVLKAINNILQVRQVPFAMISGVSVGSINASLLASLAHDFPLAVERLESMWRSLHCNRVFKTSNYHLGKTVLRNVSNILIRRRHSGYLLDSSPLRDLIDKEIDFSLINDNLSENGLQTVEILSHCYEANQTVSFYQHYEQNFENWAYPRHCSRRSDISANTVMASSALPLFFPPIKIDTQHYGDGSMGLVAPLRGAIRFSMHKVLIVGNRQPAQFSTPEVLQEGDIGLAHILGGVLNSLFLDNLDRDIEMVNRMNDIARLLSLWRKRYSPWRPLETLHLRPSKDMGHIAQEQYASMPALLRLLLNGLGARSHSGELLSFLLFEAEYTSELIDLGYSDTMAQATEIQNFFAS